MCEFCHTLIDLHFRVLGVPLSYTFVCIKMRTLILYKSRYGATKQYAQWLKEDIPASEIESIDWFVPSNLEKYDQVIIASRTYLGDIQARDFIESNWSKLKTKRVFLLAVGLIFNGDAKKTFEKLPEEIRSTIGYLKVPGRIDNSQLSIADKFIEKVMHKTIPIDMQLQRSALEPVLRFANSTSV